MTTGAFKDPIRSLNFHILLGVLSSFSKIFLIVYFYFLIVKFIIDFSRFGGSPERILFWITYLVPFEFLGRLAQANPYMPYELSKYLLVVVFVFGLLLNKSKMEKGILMLFLLLPGLFYDLSSQVNFNGIIFDFFGPLSMCLGIAFLYRRPILSFNIETFLRILVLPLISASVFLLVEIPNISDIEFVLGANFETTAGMASNQVSSVLGLAITILFYFIYNRIEFSGRRYFDLFILFVLTIQGLLTFSRGGIVGAVLVILFLVFNNSKKDQKSSLRRAPLFLIGTITLLMSFFVVNSLTGGKLLLRYQGETAGTLSGAKEKSLNTLTTNRYSILQGDIELFNRYFFGTGVGASRYLRSGEKLQLSHLEVGRALSEHGVLGLFYFIIYTSLGIVAYKNNRNAPNNILFALFMLGWYTSFHAAMRNFLVPLLSTISLVYFPRDIINIKQPNGQ